MQALKPSEIVEEKKPVTEEETETSEESPDEELTEKVASQAAENPPVEEAKEKEADEQEEIEIVEERTQLVRFKKVWHTPWEKRAPKAVRILKEFVQRHMKVQDVLISNEVNEQIWARGITKPPRKLRVRMVKDKEGKVTVYPTKSE
jgi:large subunit ribosomal protein L31e